MEARVLGIDLSDESTTLVYFGETEALTFKIKRDLVCWG